MTTQVTVTVNRGSHAVCVQIVEPGASRAVHLAPGQSHTEYLYGAKSIALTEVEGPRVDHSYSAA